MTNLDLIGGIALTAAAAITIGTLAVSLAHTPAVRIGIGAVLLGWFGLIAMAGASGIFAAPTVLGTRSLAIAVLAPVLVLAFVGTRVPAFRSALLGVPVPTLIAMNGVRVLGVFFLLLYAAGRLPAPFAPEAGWGDILVGATALPVAWTMLRRAPGWRPVALLWNALGFLDLCAAVGLAMTSTTGSPIRLFFTEPDTAIMAGLPWVIIPAFLVPIFMLTHLAVFYRLAVLMPAPTTPRATARPDPATDVV